jgi:hypothetical protein
MTTDGQQLLHRVTRYHTTTTALLRQQMAHCPGPGSTRAERLGDYPDVQAQVRIHLDETNTQLRRLEECLDACSTNPG